MESPYFGWELLWATVEQSMRGSPDLIVAFVHWQLIKFCFSCLGSGDEVPHCQTPHPQLVVIQVVGQPGINSSYYFPENHPTG